MIEKILTKLDKVRKTGKSYRACCPAHNGTNPTALSLKEIDDRVLVKCHAGCSAKEIMESIGLSLKDLFRDNLTPREKAQYRIDRLNDDLLYWCRVVKLYEFEVEDNGFKNIEREKYIGAITKKRHIESEIRDLKRANNL